MPKPSADQISKKTDRLFKKYKLWLVIPLAIAAIESIRAKSIDVAVGFAIFYLMCFALLTLSGFTAWAVSKLFSRVALSKHRPDILTASAVTGFLGTAASIGTVLSTDNSLSRFVFDYFPAVAGFSFVHPFYAIIFIAVVWIYTALRIRHYSV